MQSLNGWDDDKSPFHEGEQAIQSRLGMREKMESFGRRVIRPYLPQEHRDFYTHLPFIVVGSVDREGWPWASLLAGKPGFITSPDARSLEVEANAAKGDPLAANLEQGAGLGLLGIDLAQRRRNRVNVHVASRHGTRLSLSVDQTFGNCPQYIQTRDLEFVRDPLQPVAAASAERFTMLDDAARSFIRAADTFFVSSFVQTASLAPVEGVDISHRGGRAGFVKVDGDTLTIPDYTGNFHFNTLGNFLKNPKAGLVFPDFATGGLLLLTGTVELLWDDAPEIKAFKGAERAWRFNLDHGVHLKDALPIRWSFGDYSPNSLITGSWEEAEAALAAEARRDAWRPYRVARIEDESEVIRSFYFEPADGGGLAAFEAGQYLTVRVSPAGTTTPAIRTYTLSSAPADRHYRISVKREPQGLVSNHLHGSLKVGDVIEARAPRGGFSLDAAETRPAVLLAGGVGITPMISMARHVATEGLRTRHLRPLTIFHAAQTTGQRAFFETFKGLEQATDGMIRYVSLLNRVEHGEKQGLDYDARGYVTAAILRQALALDDYDFYLCGPGPFMQAVYDTLRELGVRDARIFAEAFGPASLARRADEGSSAETPIVEEAEEAVVKFAESGFEQRWSAGDDTLLEVAEAHGLTPDYGCRSGACGTCAVKIIAGAVAYRSAPSAAPADDDALICCSVPAEGTETLELAL